MGYGVSYLKKQKNIFILYFVYIKALEQKKLRNSSAGVSC
jgi:hypothetical protein